MDLQTLPDLDIKVLVAFDEIYKRQSLTAAAEKLGITQSAISKHLQRLRNELGDPLFLRAPKSMRMEPTPRAESLRGPISDMLCAYFERIVAAPSFDPATTERVFRIHASDLGLSVLMPILTPALEARAPYCRVQAVSGSQKDVLDGLETGALDLSISAFSTLEGIGLYQQRFCEERHVVLAREGHPLAQRGAPLDPETFASQMHILVAVGSTGHGHGRAEAWLRNAIDASHIAMEVPSFLLGMLMMQGRDYLMTAPTLAATVAPKFGLVSLACPLALPSFTVSQYWHRRFAQDPACQWLRALVRDVVAGTCKALTASPQIAQAAREAPLGVPHFAEAHS